MVGLGLLQFSAQIFDLSLPPLRRRYRVTVAAPFPPLTKGEKGADEPSASEAQRGMGEILPQVR